MMNLAHFLPLKKIVATSKEWWGYHHNRLHGRRTPKFYRYKLKNVWYNFQRFYQLLIIITNYFKVQLHLLLTWPVDPFCGPHTRASSEARVMVGERVLLSGGRGWQEGVENWDHGQREAGSFLDEMEFGKAIVVWGFNLRTFRDRFLNLLTSFVYNLLMFRRWQTYES